jgi:hypothetical protein
MQGVSRATPLDTDNRLAALLDQGEVTGAAPPLMKADLLVALRAPAVTILAYFLDPWPQPSHLALSFRELRACLFLYLLHHICR